MPQGAGSVAAGFPSLTRQTHPYTRLSSIPLAHLPCHLSPHKPLPPFSQADVVLLLWSKDSSESLQRLSDYWLPELRRMGVTVPIILVGARQDLGPEQEKQSLQQVGGRDGVTWVGVKG